MAVAKYQKIYLVSVGGNHRGEYRVTKRPYDERGNHIGRPAVCQFFGNRYAGKDITMGTLVLTEKLWREWYKEYRKSDFLPGMYNAKDAAERMVRENENIFYGCPIGILVFSTLEEAQAQADIEFKRVFEEYGLEEEYEKLETYDEVIGNYKRRLKSLQAKVNFAIEPEQKSDPAVEEA